MGSIFAVDGALHPKRDAIFVKGLLPWEDPQEIEAIMGELQEQWGNHASARLLMLPIEQAYVEMRRLMVAQRKRIEGVMLNLDIKHQFIREADLNIVLATQIPDWYFLEDDGGQKMRALELQRVQEQAYYLNTHFNDHMVPTIEQKYPDLHRYVMTGYSKSHSFLTVLGHRYRQSTPVLNLGIVGDEIDTKYRFHLLWSTEPERFEMIIASIRAQRMVEAMNLDQFSRYLTRCQNAITKGIQNLALLKQTLRIEQEHEAKLRLEQATIDLTQVNTVAANASSFTQKSATGTGDAQAHESDE